jgi:hypothetical protein
MSDQVRDDETTLGRVTWHSSDEDSGPDVGLSLGLGGGQALYVGELAEQTLEENGIGEHVQGVGWWIALESSDSLDVVGAVAKADEARELFDTIAAALSSSQERETILRERVAYLEAGILEAQGSLITQDDVIWFGGQSVETLWEHLEAVRDPEGLNPSPCEATPSKSGAA